MMTDDAKKATSVSTSEIDANPAINRFVLYAERSIKLGSYSQALDGNVGVRSAIAPAAEQKQAGSAAQLILRKARQMLRHIRAIDVIGDLFRSGRRFHRCPDAR